MCARNTLLGLLVLLSFATACAETVGDDAKLDGEPVTVAAAAEGWTLVALERAVTSPSPYANDLSQSWTVEAPESATRMQIHFAWADLEKNYDFVRVYDGEGTLVQTLTGEFSGWTETIAGAEARLELVTDYSVTRWGFYVDAVQYQSDEEPAGTWETIRLSRTDQISTPHPYANYFRDKWTIEGPADAERIRVLFTDFATELHYDFVYLYDGDGRRVAAYDGRLGDFESVSVPGRQVTVELVTDYSVTGQGFDILAYDVQRAEAGCRTDADCPAGNRCQEVWCITAPCPWMCAPLGGGEVLEVCDDAEPCRDELACTGLSGGRTAVCAESVWSSEPVTGGPVETPHPYPNNFDRCWTVQGPSWADRLAVQFEGFDTERGYDYGIVRGQQSDELYRFDGELGDFDTEPVLGSAAEVCLETDYSVQRHGFSVPSYRVEGTPSELITMAYEALGCGMGHDPSASAIRDLFAEQGVTLYGYELRRISDVVCLACPCPTGDAALVLIEPSDIPVALELGFQAFDIEESEIIEIVEPRVLEIEPRQCLMNPWDAWWQATHSRDDEMAPEPDRVRAWAAANGAKIHALWTEQTLRMVCMACNCPRGDGMFWLVSSDDALKLRRAIDSYEVPRTIDD